MDNKQTIVNFLGKNMDNTYTMHELSVMLKIPYATFYRTVGELKDILNIKQVGKAKTLQLNINNQVIKAHLAVSSDEEKKEFLKKQPILKKITSELDTKDIVLLFGSYAKGTPHEGSDIDLLIINKDGKKTLSFSKYETLFRKKFNPIFVTKKEFQAMLKDKEENVGKQALRHHILLNNPEGFWECVPNGI